MDEHLFNSAKTWLDCGLSVIPIKTDGSKAPAIKWEAYQKRRATTEELERWGKLNVGIGIVGGAVSGNLTIFDFDEPGLFQQFYDVVEQNFPEVMYLIPVVMTPRLGAHAYVRCTQTAKGNTKLAMTADGKARIETRGEGGQVLAPGCPPECHPLKKSYVELIHHITDTPTITPEELDGLIRIAKSFDQSPIPEETIVRSRVSTSNGTKRPGDDYNERGDHVALLCDAGYKRIGLHNNIEYWRRPGKHGKGISGTFNHGGHGLYYNFSASDPYFDAGRAYDRLGMLARIEFGGNISAAARVLGRMGYGEKPAGK